MFAYQNLNPVLQMLAKPINLLVDFKILLFHSLVHKKNSDSRML